MALVNAWSTSMLNAVPTPSAHVPMVTTSQRLPSTSAAATTVSFHRWLAVSRSGHCTTLVPAAAVPPYTSRYWPLSRQRIDHLSVSSCVR